MTTPPTTPPTTPQTATPDLAAVLEDVLRDGLPLNADRSPARVVAMSLADAVRIVVADQRQSFGAAESELTCLASVAHTLRVDDLDDSGGETDPVWFAYRMVLQCPELNALAYLHPELTNSRLYLKES